MIQTFGLLDPPTPATSAAKSNMQTTDVRAAPDTWTLSSIGDVNSQDPTPDSKAWIKTSRAQIDMFAYAVDSVIASPVPSSTETPAKATKSRSPAAPPAPSPHSPVQRRQDPSLRASGRRCRDKTATQRRQGPSSSSCCRLLIATHQQERRAQRHKLRLRTLQ